MKNIYTQLAKALNIAEFTEDYTPIADLQISEWFTADGYDVHVMTNDPRNLDFEYDVFCYQLNFDDIIQRIKDLDSDAIVFVSDLETYLPEDEVENYLEEELQEKHEA